MPQRLRDAEHRHILAVGDARKAVAQPVERDRRKALRGDELRNRSSANDVRIEYMRDCLLTLINGYITIDITRFGKQIEKTYPDEWNVMSITEIVTKHYGKEADDFLNAII